MAYLHTYEPSRQGARKIFHGVEYDGVVENIDFDRDVEEFRLIEASTRRDNHGKVNHLTALIEAATQRELAAVNDE